MIDDHCPHQGEAPPVPPDGSHDHQGYVPHKPCDHMTRAEFIAMIVKIYQVPMDLIRYDDHDD